jgi:hypothetical protein
MLRWKKKPSILNNVKKIITNLEERKILLHG